MNNDLMQYRHIIICDDASPYAGGIQNSAYWIARTLAEKGLSVIIAGYQPGSSYELFPTCNLEFFKLKNRVRTKYSSDLQLFRLLIRLKLHYGRQVIFYALLINNVKVFRWIRIWLGWRCVGFLHGNETLRLLHRKPVTLRKNLLACDCIFANSHYTKSLVMQLHTFTNLYVIHPGIPADQYLNFCPTDYRKRKGWQEKKVILMLSRLVARKGHATVIQAVAKLQQKHPDIQLVIAGKGKLMKEIKELVAKAGIAMKTEFLGFVPEHEKLNLYYACDIFCMPSEISEEKYDVEGFGIAFLEAAALGKVAIGADTGGIPEAIEDGKSGFLIQSGDVRGLAQLMNQILSTPERFNGMREYAKSRALTKFSWKKQVDRIIELVSRHCLR
jgi:phosphatidylinositol alpha-1,6-mannosyltransferase